MHNQDPNLEAERKRNFKVNMNSFPSPDKRWCIKKNMKLRKPITSTNRRLQAIEENKASEIKRDNSKLCKRVSSLPPDEKNKIRKKVVQKKSTLKYENNILVEDNESSN